MHSICYHGFLGGPRSMGRVGQYFLSYLLQTQRYNISFSPFRTDFMEPRWSAKTRALLNPNPTVETVDQMVTYGSVLEARKPRCARQMTPWLFYESATLPGTIVSTINANDRVYACSKFVRDVFIASGIKIPVDVLGHGFDPQHYRYRARTLDTPFIFLCVAEHTPRKNLPMLIECFERAFDNRADVQLVIKVGLHGPGDLRRAIKHPTKVRVVHQLLEDDAAMAQLYQAAHCFVLPTRGEGFGLPFLEAMATGLPVIATDFGGHLDFCTPETAYLIHNRRLVDADTRCFPHIASQWADPDEEHLVMLMRQVFSDYDTATAKARLASEQAHTSWTWSAQLSQVF